MRSHAEPAHLYARHVLPLDRPKVLRTSAVPTWEAGPKLDAGYAPRRVAVVAHWAAVPTVSRSVEVLVGELAAAGYDVIVSSAAECSGPLQWRDLPPEVSVFRRPNLGYDFGSWAQILELLPRVRSAEVALLVNDSLVGPFRPLAPLLAQMEADSAPVWGLVEHNSGRTSSAEPFHRLQVRRARVEAVAPILGRRAHRELETPDRGSL